MPALDRLQQLLRQRALLQEHLAWLDREIAEASGGAATPAPVIPPAPAPLATPIAAPRAPIKSFVSSQAAQILSASAAPAVEDTPSPAVEAVADEIIEQYRSGPDTTKTDVRKGCLLYFFGAFALLALVVVGLYFLFQRGR